MNYFKPYIEYFSAINRSDLLALIGIIVGIIGIIAVIIFNIWWDNKKKKRKRFESFQTTLLPFKHLLETGSFPNDRDNYPEFMTKLFADQDIAMTIIWDKMKGKRKTVFDQKWTEYKKEREDYKQYWDAKIRRTVAHHMGSNEMLNLINEILEIAKNN